MSMGLSGGPAKAQQLLPKLSPYMRSSPIVDHEQYAEAKRLLDDVSASEVRLVCSEVEIQFESEQVNGRYKTNSTGSTVRICARRFKVVSQAG